MTNKLPVIINSLKVPKIKKILLYEMKFLVPNYTCLQNPWLGGYGPQIPVLSVLCLQLNFLNPPQPANKIPGYATGYRDINMFLNNTCTYLLNWTITKLDTLERRILLSHSCAGNPRLQSALVLRKVEQQLLYAIYLQHERSHTRNARGYPRRSVNLVKSEQSGLSDYKLQDFTISPSCQQRMFMIGRSRRWKSKPER